MNAAGGRFGDADPSINRNASEGSMHKEFKAYAKTAVTVLVVMAVVYRVDPAKRLITGRS